MIKSFLGDINNVWVSLTSYFVTVIVNYLGFVLFFFLSLGFLTFKYFLKV